MIFIAFLFFANLLVIFFEHFSDYDDNFGLRLFNLSAEKNIPTFFSALGLFLCATLNSIIWIAHKRYSSTHIGWLGLTAIFIFLSIDEITSIHERLTIPVKELLDTSGLLYFAWVIPYGFVLAVIGMVYLPFLKRLPRSILLLFTLSVATYVTGAIGFEMVGGLQAELHGNTNLTYSLISAVEEVLEMLGIAILIYALLIYIAEALGSPTIVFKPRSRSQYLDQDQDDVKDLDDRTRGKIRRNLAS